MKHKFAYLSAGSVDEACDLKAEYGSAAQFLAGGTDLMLEWKRGLTNFDYVVDVTRLRELDYIREDSGEVRVGALTTLAHMAATVSSNPLVACMSSAARQMGTPQIRTIATIGGNICHASPSADMGVILTMFDAFAVVQSTKGQRVIPMWDFFRDNKCTAVGDDELLLEVRMPLPDRPTRAVFQRAVRSSVDLAQASVGVCLSAEAGSVVEARMAVGACAPVPVRSKSAEELLVGICVEAPDAHTIEAAVGRLEDATSPISDMRASASYRRGVTTVLGRRAVKQCLSQLTVTSG